MTGRLKQNVSYRSNSIWPWIETELLVNSADSEDEKDTALTAEQLRALKEVDVFTVNRLRGLQEELECIASCLLLKASCNNYMAALKMKMFVEDETGHKESKYMRELHKRASKRLKADNEATIVQGFAVISNSMANPSPRNQGNSRAAYMQAPGPAPMPPGHPIGKGGDKGKGKGEGKSWFLG